MLLMTSPSSFYGPLVTIHALVARTALTTIVDSFRGLLSTTRGEVDQIDSESLSSLGQFSTIPLSLRVRVINLVMDSTFYFHRKAYTFRR